MTREYQEILEQVKDCAIEYLEGVAEKRAFPSKEQLDALEFFNEALPETGTNASMVIETLHRVGSPATTAQVGGRYFGFVNGGLLPVAHAAVWLSDTWNQN